MAIHTKSYPRAALIGNPSDGYNGKTIAFLFRNFCVDMELNASDKLKLLPEERDLQGYEDITELYWDIRQFGYYGGIRLLKATIKKFFDYCKSQNIEIPKKNFTLQYRSNIPRGLGLAGSSAIITAAFKAILKYYQMEIPKPLFANLVLAVETEELSISAGLQDRVAQAYEAPVFMDFNKKIMDSVGWGVYETFPRDLLPNFFIAYRTELSEGSEVVHNNLRERYTNGDAEVIRAMERFAELTSVAYAALKDNKKEKLGDLMNENFDLRRSICDIHVKNLEMVEIARSLGASAKFTGSGGAIIGTYPDEGMYHALAAKFRPLKIEILKPDIIDQSES